MSRRTYDELLRHARRVARREDEAQDLLQTIFVAAIDAGRLDLTLAANRRWFIGALKKRALFDARTAVRRRQREASAMLTGRSHLHYSEPESSTYPARFVTGLPAALRTTALLALSGHTRAEIAWLLRLSDTALRQRISQIRRRWRREVGESFAEFPGLQGQLPYGQIRKALIKPPGASNVGFASHDLDGHLFFVSSQAHKTSGAGNLIDDQPRTQGE